MSVSPELTVAVCTCNPVHEVLTECMAAISLACKEEAPIEILLIDNDSNKLIDPSVFENIADARLIHEPRRGLIFARARAILESSCDTICFIDDDNIIDPGFIAEVIRVAREEPDLAVWAGRARGRFGRRPGTVVRHYLPRYAVRDHGDFPLTGRGDVQGPWSPIGAGMAVRKPVALAYVDVVKGLETDGLGHSGDRVGAGEDTLFALIAARMGLDVGYRPGMSLEHVIPAARLEIRYLASLLQAQGRSEAILSRFSNRSFDVVPCGVVPFHMAARFLLRLASPGWPEAIGHLFWDWGWFSTRCRQPAVWESFLKSGLDKLEGSTSSSART